MDSYSVRYKLSNQIFFRKIKNLVEDGYIDDKDIRYFITKDRKRYEIAATGIFEFSDDRHSYVERLNQKNAAALESNEVIPGVPLPE
jgi:predicted transcriptional regulator